MFIPLDVIINELLVSFLDCSLLGHRNTVKIFFFFALILQLTALLNSYLSFSCFLLKDSLVYFVKRVLSFVKTESFISFFSNFDAFHLFFSCLKALTRTSSTMLNSGCRSKLLILLGKPSFLHQII